jgi:hypothetical protein
LIGQEFVLKTVQALFAVLVPPCQQFVSYDAPPLLFVGVAAAQCAFSGDSAKAPEAPAAAATVAAFW